MEPVANQTKLAVILHADVVGSTGLVQKDERAAHESIREAFSLLSSKVTQAGGSVHEVRGDALVALFDRASDAAKAALSYQTTRRNAGVERANDLNVLLRMGIALGEVIVDDSTITGAGVILAQRLEQLAEPGGVCVSAAVREAIPGRLNLRYQDLGEHLLKGFDQPQRTYRVLDDIGANESNSPATSTTDSRESNTRRASIAVLPFVNIGADPEGEFFADGMTEDITTALSKFKQLMVIARGTTFSLKGKSVDAISIAQDLKVNYLVEGSIRRSGHRLRASTQLVDGNNGTQLWSDRFDRDIEDVFAVQDELTEAITVAIAPQIDRTERELARQARPNSLDAWSLLQAGLSRMMQDTGEALRDAEDFFRRAFSLDANYAAAFAWAAFNRSQRIVFGAVADATLDVDEAVSWAERAIELDKDDPVCQMALGRALIARGSIESSTRALDRAVELNPNFAIAYIFLGVARHLFGEADTALRHAEIAVRLCPSDAWGARAYLLKSSSLRTLNRVDESIEAGKIACDLAPAMFATHAYLAASLGLANQIEEGRAAWRKALELEPELTTRNLIERRGSKSPVMRDAIERGLRRLGLEERSASTAARS